MLMTSSGFDISGALTTLGSIVTSCVGWITDNPVLSVIFVAGLVPVGFKVIRSAKRTSK